MADEDQRSHFDDPEEKPIKVSVTFKPQEQDTDENHNNFDQPRKTDEPSPDDSQRNDNNTCNDSETEEPSLPANPPVTPIPSFLKADKANSGDHGTEKHEVLEGWKGYGNNIYIQPIIVNHAICEECHCQAYNKTKRRLTSEDLRKQLRLREANNWITKHNERIRSTGTLRSSAQYQQEKLTSKQEGKGIPKQANEKEITKLKQRKSKTKLHKGFVCRTWATNYLSKDDQSNEDDEFIPFFVQKYVDKSESNLPHSDKKTSTPFAEENRNNSTTTSTRIEPEDTLSQNILKELKTEEFQLKEKHNFDVLDNREKRRNIKTSARQLQNSSRDSYKLICSCGKAITHNKEMSNSGKSATNHLRNERVRNSKVRFSVALPIKQFPPIDPLQELKRQNFPPRRKQEVLLTRRPHTVDTARLSKGIILVNGHHNLPNFRNASQSAFDRQYCGQRGTPSSLENFNKEAQIFVARVKSEPQNCRTGCKRFDGERNGGGRFGRHRSLSEPRATAKFSSKDLGENGDSLYRDSVECFTATRRRVRTPPHSLNSEDNDSNTDSNDTGLGSEVEYCFDGLAKLDVYLQPRSTSFHDD